MKKKKDKLRDALQELQPENAFDRNHSANKFLLKIFILTSKTVFLCV